MVRIRMGLCVPTLLKILILEKVIETGKFVKRDYGDLHLITLRNLDVITSIVVFKVERL